MSSDVDLRLLRATPDQNRGKQVAIGDGNGSTGDGGERSRKCSGTELSTAQTRQRWDGEAEQKPDTKPVVVEVRGSVVDTT